MLAMNSIMSSQAMWLEAIEKRISATSSMLGSMKGIKMCGLRDTLLASMQKLRVDELRISRGFRKLLIWNMLFGEHDGDRMARSSTGRRVRATWLTEGQ